MLIRIVNFLSRIGKKIILLILNLYQKFFSPDHSFWSSKFYPCGYCKFHPTCSEYCKQSIKKKGVIKGSLKCFWRVLRCNPWNDGGVDKP
ncbi:MAG: membrane protein insertion efficiency factor YidD [Candidatus Magasanikbacteria bacterium]